MQSETLLKKLRPGHKCRYINKNPDPFMGFITGKDYYVVERLPKMISFTTNKILTAIDFGIAIDGEYFFKHWYILDEEYIAALPDIDFTTEDLSYNHHYRKLNSQITF
jgi:hypothetical protein